ncbi:YfgM family protein [Novipirellula artificiosorum]|uniref:Tetratricopeptide repeat-like domain-containing protein n=1 Tax=Novipirellula artificiosorum TaxID=2528016 RepID=A0A5C6DJ89_9BACT|nr:tetratricopeptide repeat protein [Novipirellula artificiosorum]TWU34969.1 hypothetical protein Poly41_41130 [Novipirellula artificiosorum]
MKSERRHELQENILANHLGNINRAIEPYSRQIAIAVVLLAVAAIWYSLYSSKVSGRRSDATLKLIQESETQDPEALATVGTQYPGAPAASWADLYRGSALLAQGTRTLFLNRSDAETQLSDAKTAFESALSNGKDKLLKSRAHYGIARSAEAMGSIEEAIAAYEDCIKVGESEEMAKACQDRITALNDPDTTKFMAWFADQDFTPADPSLPPSLPSGSSLPDLPDLNLPDLDLGETSDEAPVGGLDMPAGSEQADVTDETAANAAEETSAAEETGAVEEASAVEETDDVEETSAAEEVSDAEETDASESRPEAETTAPDPS